MEKRSVSVFFIVILFITFVSAEKLEINAENSYYPGEDIEIKIVLYDDQNNKIFGKINFEIQNYYTEIFKKGEVDSGGEIVFRLPENSIRGHWSIIVRYNDLERKELFNVLELEKAEIKIEGNELIITNVGNIPYRKSIQIEIGDHKETALVPLVLGETKRIKLTAPDGEYDVKVSDGTEKNDIIFNRVPLTGNVIGLEKISKSFFKEYSLVILFFVVVLLAFIISWFRGRRKIRGNKK